MRHPNTITLVPRQHKQKSYLDFVIDQRSLADCLLPKRKQPFDCISPFSWPGDLGRTLAAAAAARLLRKAPPDLATGRYSLLVCPECTDLECGTLSAVIERQHDLIVWHSFGFETNSAEQLDLEPFVHVHEFAFRADLYSALFRPYLH